MANNKVIAEKIEEIYTSKDKNGNQTGKNFISHLIRAYIPTDKIEKVSEKTDKKMRCAITGRPLFSLLDIEKTVNSDEFINDFQKEILYTLNPENNTKGSDHPIKKFIGGKQLGITGNKTNTYLCVEAYEEFTEWIFKKILAGDKHLEWVIRNMNNKQLTKHLNSLLPKPENTTPNPQKKAFKKPAQMYTTSSTVSKSTFGDFSVLQNLKKQLESGNK